MSRTARLIVAALLPGLLAFPAAAYQDAPAGREELGTPSRDLLALDEDAVARLRPVHREMREILLAEREALTRLHAEYEAAPGIREALAVQRRMGEVKQETECSLLRVQAKHARLAGRDDLADRLEAVAASLDPRTSPATDHPR